MNLHFGILGGGSWATALAKLLTDNGHHINWWIRNTETINAIKTRHHNPHYLSAVYFDTSKLHIDSNIQNVIQQSNAIIVCIPSAYILSSFFELPVDIFKNKMVISAVKGILPNGEHQLLNEYLSQYFSVSLQDFFTIMGPCHAEEVASEKLSYLTFSGIGNEQAAVIAKHFKNHYLNTIVNHDVWGSQYAAVMKNIYAVGAGIAHGLDYGDNFLSVYISNASGEMSRFLEKTAEKKSVPIDGDNKLNYSASVYLGDLLVTCYSLFSRNRTFGTMIGKGYSVKVAQLEMNMVAEGYPASKGVYEVNKRMKVDMPISETIYKILWENLDAAEGFRHIEKHLC